MKIRKSKKLNLDKSKKITKIPKFAIFMFTMLQNSITIEQFDNYLINIYNVFESKYKDSTVQNSLDILSTELINRNIDLCDVLTERTPEQLERDSLFEIQCQLSDLPREKQLTFKENSPFQKYYEKRRLNFKELLSNKAQKENLIENDFYCPGLYDLITEEVYMLPFWTGLMISPIISKEKLKTRLSNNIVENYFGHVKKNLLQKRKVTTSELGTIFFQRLYSLSNITKTENEEIKNEMKKEQLFHEMWSDKKIKRSTNEKRYFFMNHDLFKNNTIYNSKNAFQNDFKLVSESLKNMKSKDQKTNFPNNDDFGAFLQNLLIRKSNLHKSWYF